MNRAAGPAARRWAMVGVVVLLTAAGTIAADHRGRSAPPDPGDRPSVGTPAALPRLASPVRIRSTPVSLRIPAIRVAVPVSALGLNPDGTVEVPTDYARAGWFNLGPSPGQLGSAVILGHVDSHDGPAAFFRLRSLRAGDRVEVGLADGTVNTFAVRAVGTYPKKQFPARLVYGSHGYSALQLVTCGGEFDERARSYVSNVVAYTALVATTRPGAGRAPA